MLKIILVLCRFYIIVASQLRKREQTSCDVTIMETFPGGAVKGVKMVVPRMFIFERIKH